MEQGNLLLKEAEEKHTEGCEFIKRADQITAQLDKMAKKSGDGGFFH